MNFGMIRAVAAFEIPGCGPVLRFLVLRGNDDFNYLYIGASNYRFRTNDILTWDETTLYWHAERETIRFNLLQTGVAIQ